MTGAILDGGDAAGGRGVSLLFRGWLWGPVGALLAVSIAAGLRIVLANIPATAPLAR